MIDAVLQLAQAGGYDAVQLRPVSDLSGIGMDTIYRYFGSRDRLIAAAVAQWLENEFFAPAPSWPEGDTPAEQVLAICRHVWDVWERNPNMLQTFSLAALADDDTENGLASLSRRRLMPIWEAALARVPADFRADALMIIDSVTHSAMTFTVRGQIEVTEVFPRLERTIRRLAEHPAMRGHRPDAWGYE